MYTAPVSSATIPYVFKEKESLFSVLSLKDPSVMLARLASLLEWGGNVNETEYEFNLNILQKCIIDEYSDEELINIVSILLDNEIDVNHQDGDGCTALHFAICEEHYGLAKILLNNGANPAIVDKRGETAFDDLKNLINADPLKAEQREEMQQLLKITAKDAVKYIIDQKLTTANLSKFQDFDHSDLKNLSENCPQLKKLTIRSIKFSDSNLEEALEKFSNLRSLDIGWCIQMTGDALRKSSNLKNLNLSGWKQISGSKLLEVLEKSNSIQSLNLAWSTITVDKLENMIENFHNLKNLNVSNCTRTTDEDFEKIVKKYPFIQISK